MSPSRLLVKALATFALIFFTAKTLPAQVPDPTIAAQAPVPGAGHHYIGNGAETVNPADGSLSFDLPLQPPPGRGLSAMFGIRFSGGEQFYLSNRITYNQNLVWTPNWEPAGQAPWQVGAWSYDLPILTATTSIFWSATIPNNGCPNGVCTYSTNYCYGNDSYVFRGLDGVQYSVPLGSVFPDPNNQQQGFCPAPPGNVKSPSNNHGILSSFQSSSLTNIVDQSGTTYQFPVGSGQPSEPIIPPSNPIMWGDLATSITDRNGNQFTLSGNSYKDSTGRTAVSWTGIGNTGDQITVSGLGGPITLKWTTTPVSYPETGYNSGYTQTPCALNGGSTNSVSVMSEIDLPNGQKYTFQYDGTYGKVSKITFPDGGYVRYAWGLSRSAMAIHASWTIGQSHTPESCDFIFDVPAVTDRYVSFDGSTEVLHQQFSYALPTWSLNTWSTKQTTVTSTDLLTNQVTKTVYTYGPATADANVYVTQAPYSRQIPVETNVLYQDGTGKTYKEINKTWLNPRVMLAEQTILYDSSGNRSAGSATVRCYNANEQVTNAYEYGFQSEGSYPGDQSCYSSVTKIGSLNNSYIGPLRRQTTNAYHPFFTWNGGTPPTWSGTHIVNAPDSVTVADSSNSKVAETDYAYDNPVGSTTSGIVQHGAGCNCGNLTKESRWVNSSGTTLSTTFTNDDTGQRISMTDPRGSQTIYSYADNYSSGTPPGPTNAYLTQVTHPNTGVAHIEKFGYAYATGQVTSSTDQNNLVTSYQYVDSLARLTETDLPDGGRTSIVYNDSTYNPSTPSPSVITTKKINATTSFVTVSAVDGLGHPTESQLTSDPDNPTATISTYDGFGRPRYAYNPTRCGVPTTNCGENTWGYITYAYDGLGRTISVTAQDGSVTTTSYSGNCTTITDPAGKARKSCTDGLGRLTQVFEDPAGLTYETDYTYDALNNLLTVNQKGGSSNSANWRTRTFNYDSLSRLLCASNPENSSAPCPVTATGNYTAGTTGYTYDPNGNLSSRVSPAPNQTGTATVTLSYCYDALNRLTSKAYTAQSCPMSSSIASYLYDQSSYNGLTITNGIGRRTGMTDQAGSEAWSYDSMGRPLRVQRTTNGITKSFLYTYNLDGSPYQMTYPGQSSPLTYTQGGAGRPLQLVSAGGVYITANVHYTPGGDLCYRQDDWDGAWTTTKTFNNRLQPVTIQSVQQFSSPPPPVCGISQIYSGGCCTSLLDLTYSFTDPFGHNNGNVQRINNNLNMERTQLFSYDSLNRLSNAETLSTNQPWYQGDQPLRNCWGEQYTYDPWGNLTTISPVSTAYTGCSQENLSMLATTKNQLQDTNNDFVYDSAGNLTQPGPIGGPYVYDAENHLTSASGVTYTYDGDGNRVMKSNGTIYWYGANSAALEETDLSGNIQRWYYFFDGKRVSRQLPTNEVGFYMTDHLGNVRYLGGSATGYSIDYYPFGGIIVNSDIGDDRYQFTGKERDSESGLDNFGARYDSSQWGRFMSPDDFTKDSDVRDPQSWNKYAYARNNPLRYLDPTGETATETVTCNQDNTACQVNITASVAIYAAPNSGLTQDQLKAAADTIKGSIEGSWNGSFQDKDGVTYSVSTKVDVSVVGSEAEGMKSGAQNVIGISNGAVSQYGQVIADSITNQRGVMQTGPDTGIWNMEHLGIMAKHEFTHLLGIPNQSCDCVSNGDLHEKTPSRAQFQDLRLATQGIRGQVQLNNFAGQWPNFSVTQVVQERLKGRWWLP